MYQCPSCGGGLRYDIPSKLLACDYCGTKSDPYQIVKEQDGYVNDTYAVNCFTCPQCGGEILTTDNSCAEFCSYCGASTILTSRIQKEQKPNLIVPFEMTKEDCIKSYKRRMKWAIFAPGRLKRPGEVQGFRGIYMPYWKYKLMQPHSHARFEGYTSNRSGDYIIKKFYQLDADVDGLYDGFYYDSSSTFYDNISVNVAPFDVREQKEFTPSFLSGFYADSADVPPYVYQQEANDQAVDYLYDQLKKNPAFKKYTIDDTKEKRNVDNSVRTQLDRVDGMMLPVWFMSYRSGKRVAYATVNGQTGKIVADIPVSIWKYLIGSILTAIPIFFLLQMLVTYMPAQMLGTVQFVTLYAAALNLGAISGIRKNLLNENDKGLQYRNGNYQIGKKLSNSITSIGSWIVYMCMLIILAPISGVISANIPLPFLGIMVMVFSGIGIGKRVKLKGEAKGLFTYILALVLEPIVGLIQLFQPVSDLWYYGGAIGLLVVVLLMIIDIIRNYNVLATRRLPQFDRKGGNDGVQ